MAFPTRRDVERPEGRGRLLHFFANHELLALELMALALLRFRDAPEAWRRGLVGIIAEEQRHLGLYLSRMEGTGVQFGDLPVNRYFWTALADAPSPLAFTAGLALTFEQANLDHAAWWAGVFHEIGDEATAAALDEVLRDEIGHVRHGLKWFDAWRDPLATRWDAWVAALPPPLTPARARGPAFTREARLAAGFDDATIERVAIFGASKGRPPTVHLFNPGAEDELAGIAPGKITRAVTADLAPLLVFDTRTDDVVLVPKVPRTAFLSTLARAGFSVPELVAWNDEPLARSALAGRKLGAIRPWAASPRLSGLGFGAWDPRWRALAGKVWAAGQLEALLHATSDPALSPPDVVGVPCTTLEAVTAELCRLTDRGYPRAALKAPLAAAGRGVRPTPTLPPGGSPPAPIARFIADTLARQGTVLVEPWLDRVADLSVQLEVAPDGSVKVEPWGRFLADAAGHYEGAVLGRALDGLPQDVLRFAHSRDSDRISRLLGVAARHVGRALAAEGYAGPAGIDALLHRLPDGEIRLRPILEVNLRNTMGRVALALGRRLRGGRVGLWRQYTREARPDLPRLAERHPLRTHGDPPLLDHGVLFTTDPADAQVLYTVLAVGRSLAECQALLAE